MTYLAMFKTLPEGHREGASRVCEEKSKGTLNIDGISFSFWLICDDRLLLEPLWHRGS
jgi:hypothetical protein